MVKNIKTRVVDGKLIIEIDLSKDFGLSNSGKSTVIASTSGGMTVPGLGGVRLGLNCYKPSNNGRGRYNDVYEEEDYA